MRAARRGLRRASGRTLACVALLAGCGARSELRSGSADDLVCPRTAVHGNPNEDIRLALPVPDWSRPWLRWSIEDSPTPDGFTLTPRPSGEATLRASVEGEYVVRVQRPSAPGAEYRDGGRDGGAVEACDLFVNVGAQPPRVTCPTDLETTPRRAVSVSAQVAAGRPIVERAWSVRTSPPPSARPRPTPPDQDATSFTPDVAGDYTLHYEVRDVAGASGSCDVRVHARPVEALHVEMFWNPPDRSCPEFRASPSCDDSDVDLHLLRNSRGLWGSSDDCYYANCISPRLEWDASGRADDPRLDLDDTHGFGPENINIDRAGSAMYRVGVHLYRRHAGATADATVLIYCAGAAAPRSFGPVTLHGEGDGPGFVQRNDFWLVADVVMTASGCDVVPIHRGDGPWIVRFVDATHGAGPAPPGG